MRLRPIHQWIRRGQSRCASSLIRKAHSTQVPPNEVLLHRLLEIEHEHGSTDSNESSTREISGDGELTDRFISRLKTNLPQSPLTDPKLNAARFGHKAHKPLHAAEPLSEFQEKLLRNPYAHALATPVRLELLTQARLPRFFLQQFGFTKHPETELVWQLPTLAFEASLLRKKDEASKSANEEVEARSFRKLHGSNFLSTARATKYLAQLPRSKMRRVTPFQVKRDGALRNQDPVFREDMSEFIAELMRGKMLSLLTSLQEHEESFIVPCQMENDAASDGGYATLLRLDNEDSGAEDAENSTENSAEDADAKDLLETRVVNDRNLPVYDLRDLLGESRLVELKQRFPSVYDHDVVAIKDAQETLQLQMHIWKMIGYLRG